MVDYLILVTLRSEREAVLKQFEAAGANTPTTNSQDDLEIDLPLRASGSVETNGERVRIVVHSANEPGRESAALDAYDITTRLSPRVILLVGVAGGVKGRTALGDVMVADQILDIAERELTEEMSPQPQVYRPSKELLSAVKRVAPGWFSEIAVARPDSTGTPRVLVGSLASSDRIIGSPTAIDRLRGSFKRLRGVDVESAGVAAALERVKSRSEVIVIRGIADELQPDKRPEWREYAIHAAASFSIAFIRAHQLSTAAASVKAAQSTAGAPEGIHRTAAVSDTDAADLNAMVGVGSGNSGRWIPEILAPSPETLAA